MAMSEGEAKTEAAALEGALRRRFRVAESAIAVGERRVELLHPASADDLISEEDYIRDERLPYWAEPWPSGLVLAATMASRVGHGRRLLELGCGAGLVAVAASLAGFVVTATDYYDDALGFAWLNVWRSTHTAIDTRMVDWRAMPDDLKAFDVVIASDVLYEKHYAALVASALARTLSPRGVALIADPGRIAAPAFLECLTSEGLHVARKTRVPYVNGEIKQTIDVYEITWAGRDEALEDAAPAS
jgi:predicted nicotinamide N-methyase